MSETSMATLTLSIPDDVLRRAMANMNCRDEADLHDILLRLVEARATDGAPIDKELKAKLLEGLSSPLLEVTEDYWQAKVQQYDARHRKRKRA
jgi:hypothetical protein